jgi:hypothetical protein
VGFSQLAELNSFFVGNGQQEPLPAVTYSPSATVFAGDDVRAYFCIACWYMAVYAVATPDMNHYHSPSTDIRQIAANFLVKVKS